MIVAIFGEVEGLAWCKCNDKKWRRLYVPENSRGFVAPFQDVIFYKGKLLALDYCDRLLVLKIFVRVRDRR